MTRWVPSLMSARGLCSSSRLADLLKATRRDHSIVWMAPCAQTLKPAAAAAAVGSRLVFHDQVEPKFFTGSVPERPTTIVVSAQTVSMPFLQAWRQFCREEERLLLVRRGTSLGSIDVSAATDLGIEVINTPGVNSPHVAKFTADTLGLSSTAGKDTASVRAVVVGAGSVGRCVVDLMTAVGVRPTVVNRSPESPSLRTALRGATHVAVCAATSGEPIITTSHVQELLEGDERAITLCSVSRPEAFSLEAILMIAQATRHRTRLHFDYGDSILAPMREKVDEGGVKSNVSWSSKAMASEECKQDMDQAVLALLTQ